MDCKLKRDSIVMQELIYDNCEEKPIDLTISLPDYCPDIQKILKCMVEPVVSIRTVVGDRFETEGQLLVKVLYLDAEGAVLRLCEKNIPFTSAVTLRKTPESPVVFAKAKTEYVNCRAVSPRKLDIHGAFSIYGKVSESEKYEFVCGIDEEGIEQKIQSMKATRLLSSSNQQFVLSEVLEIDSGKFPAETIVRHKATAIIDDRKVVSGKVVLKGQIKLNVLYLSSMENMQLEKCEYTVPFSEVLDCSGVNDESLCDVRVFVAEEQLQIRTDASGENMLFEFEGRIIASVTAFEETEIQVVTDAYSVMYETELERKQLRLNRVGDIAEESFVQKFEVELSDPDLMQLIDLWDENLNIRTETVENSVSAKGKVTVCALFSDRAGHPKYAERMVDIDFAKEIRAKSGNIKCDADYAVKEISGRMVGNKLEVRVEITCFLRVSYDIGAKSVFSAFMDESRRREKKFKDSLVIYYADQDEKLWDIARMYCTSVDVIKLENAITYDMLSDGEMILIPT